MTEREFLEQLHELNHKINFVKEQSYKETRSSNDVRDILEKLKFKVGVQSSTFLLHPFVTTGQLAGHYSVLSLISELSFSRISESVTGYTFTPCVDLLLPLA